MLSIERMVMRERAPCKGARDRTLLQYSAIRVLGVLQGIEFSVGSEIEGRESPSEEARSIGATSEETPSEEQRSEGASSDGAPAECSRSDGVLPALYRAYGNEGAGSWRSAEQRSGDKCPRANSLALCVWGIAG